MLIVGILPIALIMLVALHLVVNKAIFRMVLLIGITVACFSMGYASFALIGIVLACVEVIFNKATGTKLF